LDKINLVPESYSDKRKKTTKLKYPEIEENTACYEEARALTNGLKKVREHLNFK
jgi:hypothetical protein